MISNQLWALSCSSLIIIVLHSELFLPTLQILFSYSYTSTNYTDTGQTIRRRRKAPKYSKQLIITLILYFQVVAKRLLHYIAAGLLSTQDLGRLDCQLYATWVGQSSSSTSTWVGQSASCTWLG